MKDAGVDGIGTLSTWSWENHDMEDVSFLILGGTFKTTVLGVHVAHSTQAPVANDGDGDDGRQG